MDASSFFKGAWPWGLGVICETVERSLAQRGYDMRPIVVAPPVFQGHPGGLVMDIYDGVDWTEMDIDDLRGATENGSSIEEARNFFAAPT